MLHWIQYLRGYVVIKVWGYSVERLLNLLGNHNILVWDIEDHGAYHTMHISIDGFFTEAVTQKNRNEGGCFGEIWPALFSIENDAAETLCGGTGLLYFILVSCFPLYLGYQD